MKHIIKGILFGLLLIIGNIQCYATTDSVTDYPLLKPEIQHSTAADRVFTPLMQEHYRMVTQDNKFSQAIFLRYLQWLDPTRTLLIQSEVAELQTHADDFLKQISQGDLDEAYYIYNFVTQKRVEFLHYALTLLERPMDFTVNENINLNVKELNWENNSDQLQDLWRKKVKYDELTLLLLGKTPEQVKEILTKRYKLVLKRLTQTRSEDVFVAVMNAFAREIDPHTSYLSPRINQQFNSEINLSLEGIGAVLREEEDAIVITSLVKGGPAEKSGLLKEGDKIIGVGASSELIDDVVGMRLDDVVDKIKGPKGSSVFLEVIPNNQESMKAIEIVRDKIRLEDSAAKLTIKELNNQKVGVITIPGFYIDLTKDIQKILEQVMQQKLTAVVVDLRHNGGGALTEAIGLTGLFIPKGPVVQVRDKQNNILRYDSDSSYPEYLGPLVVLINQYSASASEIFAAALQDYGRALIVGETSFGKGTVQTHRPLTSFYDLIYHPTWPELGAIQYTVQKFYRINGGSTQLKGVTPEIILPAIEREYGERFEENPLPWDKIPAVEYTKTTGYQADIAELRRMSQRRIGDNLDFQFIKQDIEKYNKERSLLYVASLNRQQREQEKQLLAAEELTRLNLKLAQQSKPLVMDLEKYKEEHKKDENDPYLDETVLIALDYAAMLNEKE